MLVFYIIQRTKTETSWLFKATRNERMNRNLANDVCLGGKPS